MVDTTTSDVASTKKPYPKNRTKWDEGQIQIRLEAVLAKWDETYSPKVFPPAAYFEQVGEANLYAKLTRSEKGVGGYAKEVGRPITRPGRRSWGIAK